MIFENAYLTDDEKIRACHLTEAAGADFVKTSTGFAPSGATHDDLRLMRANTSPHDPGQGGRRRPDARRAARGHGPRRDARSARPPTETIIDDFRARKAGLAVGAAAASAGRPRRVLTWRRVPPDAR